MTKAVLAIGAFILGVCCGVASFALCQTPPQRSISAVGGGGEPVVPPLSTHLSNFGLNWNVAQSLDGIDCDGCTLNVERLTYAGGAYRLINTDVRRNTPIELKGAALNTVNLLLALGALSSAPAPVAPAPNTKEHPNKNKKNNELEIKPQGNFNIVSLEGLQRPALSR